MRDRFFRFLVLLVVIGSWLGSGSAWAETDSYLQRAMQQVSEFRLANGIKFILYERHQAPVVSFLTYADVGGANEVLGKTGVAHFLEHLAFKGTTQIGTRNYAAEQPLMEKQDSVFAQLQQAKAAGKPVESLQAEFDKIGTELAKLVTQNEFGQIVQQAGGVGLNANTSTDATRYFYSFPANKLEVWMALESERFLQPVFREFYQEKAVILEERRMRKDDSPIGQMVEALAATAFKVHPYGRPVIGSSADIANLTRQDVKDFFEAYYVPANLTMAVVGDVDPAQVKQMAQAYFGRFPARPLPRRSIPAEPEQREPREITLQLASEPWYLEGYRCPSVQDPDSVVVDLISAILSQGRTSRLYQALVEKKLALAAQGFNGFPGEKYPNLMMFYAQSAPGQNLDSIATALRAELTRLQTDPVSAQELDRIRTQSRAGLLRALDSNQGMAGLLLEAEVKQGGWKQLFRQLEQLDKITPADIQRVARQIFQPEHRIIGRLLTKA